MGDKKLNIFCSGIVNIYYITTCFYAMLSFHELCRPLPAFLVHFTGYFPQHPGETAGSGPCRHLLNPEETGAVSTLYCILFRFQPRRSTGQTRQGTRDALTYLHNYSGNY